jgi:drug/metabolite transporter (DMT)-like permease
MRASAANSTSGAREAYVALAVLAMIWGYTWVVIKLATQDASPFFVAGMRALLGVLALFATLAITRRSLRPTPFIDTVIYGLLQTTGFTGLQTMAVSQAGAGKVAVLAYTMPFWVVLLAWPVLGERITRNRTIALVIAALGLALVVMPLDKAGAFADLLAVGAGISWAASVVWAKRVRSKHNVDLLSLTTWQMVWGTIPLIAIYFLVPEHVHVTARLVASLIFLALFSQAVAWSLWLFIVSRLPAGLAGIASLATPVVGVVAAAIQLHEIPSITEIAGILLIVVALAIDLLRSGV